MLGLLYVAVLIACSRAAGRHPLREATGDPALWLLIGARGGAGLALSRGVGPAAGRAAARPEKPPAVGAFSEAELNRYARHIMLREIGGPGQKALGGAGAGRGRGRARDRRRCNTWRRRAWARSA
jgi:hypothetical protein